MLAKVTALEANKQADSNSSRAESVKVGNMLGGVTCNTQVCGPPGVGHTQLDTTLCITLWRTCTSVSCAKLTKDHIRCTGSIVDVLRAIAQA